ncbi:helix-turn-helix transcriptional regulator [Arthrobacter sp. EpRS71]|uniref:helix-turn-helix transcriptional regulator n=1 Tax=Arthrobacter sp. EpRS71 TaxID=1743141 RepID=UPI0018D20F5A|nr:helix-turn-helix transcriptional regulator [Arthrobacter sp. EpRS71]
MKQKLKVRDGLIPRLREMHRLPSEESQARLMGVSRSTLRRMESGEQPSADFIVAMCTTYDLGIGEAFQIVSTATHEKTLSYANS